MRWVFLVNLSRLLLKARELGYKVVIFTFYRSPEDQAKEFAAGRSRTRNGFHPLWLAVDLAIVDDWDEDGRVSRDEIRWKKDVRYLELARYWEMLGGVWGGRWKDPVDWYHFEWSEKMNW